MHVCLCMNMCVSVCIHVDAYICLYACLAECSDIASQEEGNVSAEVSLHFMIPVSIN